MGVEVRTTFMLRRAETPPLLDHWAPRIRKNGGPTRAARISRTGRMVCARLKMKRIHRKGNEVSAMSGHKPTSSATRSLQPWESPNGLSGVGCAEFPGATLG
jgi:hypothetical protein